MYCPVASANSYMNENQYNPINKNNEHDVSRQAFTVPFHYPSNIYSSFSSFVSFTPSVTLSDKYNNNNCNENYCEVNNNKNVFFSNSSSLSHVLPLTSSTYIAASSSSVVLRNNDYSYNNSMENNQGNNNFNNYSSNGNNNMYNNTNYNNSSYNINNNSASSSSLPLYTHSTNFGNCTSNSYSLFHPPPLHTSSFPQFYSSSFVSNVSCSSENFLKNTTSSSSSLACPLFFSNFSFFSKEKIFYLKDLPVRIQLSKYRDTAINKISERELEEENEKYFLRHEEFIQLLRFKITKVFLTSSSNHLQSLRVELTKEDDPCFLYTLEMDEREFLSLKNKQSLIVEFQNFANKFVELLDKCEGKKYESYEEENEGRKIKELQEGIMRNITSREDNDNSNSIESSMICALKIEDNFSMLYIIERNKFRELMHFFLKFLPASNQTIKTHLTNLISSLKKENESIRESLNQNNKSQIILQNELQKARIELQTAKNQNEIIINKLKEEHKTEMQSLQISLNNERENFFMLKKNEIECLNDKIRNIEKEWHISANKVSILERNEKEFLNNKHFLEEEIQKKNDLINSFKEKMNYADEKKKNDKKQMEELTEKVRDHELTLKEHERKNEDLKCELLHFENDNKQLVDQLQISKKHNEVLQKQIQESAEEIHKGNSIINRLQNQIKIIKTKFKNKCFELIKKEKEFDELSGIYEKIRKEIQEEKNKIQQISKNECNLEEDNERLKLYNEKLQKECNHLKQVNQHINNELTNTRIELMMKNYPANHIRKSKSSQVYKQSNHFPYNNEQAFLLQERSLQPNEVSINLKNTAAVIDTGDLSYSSPQCKSTTELKENFGNNVLSSTNENELKNKIDNIINTEVYFSSSSLLQQEVLKNKSHKKPIIKHP